MTRAIFTNSLIFGRQFLARTIFKFSNQIMPGEIHFKFLHFREVAFRIGILMCSQAK